MANILRGLAGNDTLDGGLGFGFDTLNGGVGADVLIGGAGSDTASYAGSAAGVTVDLARGTASGGDATGDALFGIENLVGSSHADAIVGNALINVLAGGHGSDTLTGGGNSDAFVLNTALEAGNVDTITDFKPGEDKIRLENAVMKALTMTGDLAAGAFAIGNQAADAGDRIIYDAATGALFYDRDGLGIAAIVQFAQLAMGLALTAGDFEVI